MESIFAGCTLRHWVSHEIWAFVLMHAKLWKKTGPGPRVPSEYYSRAHTLIWHFLLTLHALPFRICCTRVLLVRYRAFRCCGFSTRAENHVDQVIIAIRPHSERVYAQNFNWNIFGDWKQQQWNKACARTTKFICWHLLCIVMCLFRAGSVCTPWHACSCCERLPHNVRICIIIYI